MQQISELAAAGSMTRFGHCCRTCILLGPQISLRTLGEVPLAQMVRFGVVEVPKTAAWSYEGLRSRVVFVLRG